MSAIVSAVVVASALPVEVVFTEEDAELDVEDVAALVESAAAQPPSASTPTMASEASPARRRRGLREVVGVVCLVVMG